MGAEITTARTSETARLRKRREKGRIYVYDRGFADYGLFQKVIDAGSSFVGRVHQNAVYEIVEERRVTAEAKAAGIQFDRVVRLGGPGASAPDVGPAMTRREGLGGEALTAGSHREGRREERADEIAEVSAQARREQPGASAPDVGPAMTRRGRPFGRRATRTSFCS